MGVPEWIAVISVVVVFLSLALQQHFTRQQNKSEAKARHYDRAQVLILRALDDLSLLEAISGTSEEDQKQRRYRQLWFNHVEMIFRQRQFFDRPHWRGTINDIRSFMNMPAMREHWSGHHHYYAQDFRSFMDEDIMGKEAEAPKTEAPPEVDQASIT